jgi:predicted nucleic acid-binding protein
MDYILDTNILLSLVRSNNLGANISREFDLFNAENQVYISIAARAEILSIAKKRDWGNNKIQKLEKLLKNFTLVNLCESIVQKYAEIDIYSQGKDKNRNYPKGFSAMNMGENDIWIAATAAVTSSTLLTTDKDFDHLNTVFIPVIRIDIENYR